MYKGCLNAKSGGIHRTAVGRENGGRDAADCETIK